MARFVPKAILIDLSGTVHVENSLISGVAKALSRLKASGVHYRFVTNTTKETASSLVTRLTNLGVAVAPNDVFSSLSAAHRFISHNNVRPMLFLEDSVMEDFKDVDTSEPNTVVVGLAPSHFHYERLTEAFNCLNSGAHLVAINKSRYFQRKQGLALGGGAFVAALEYAADKQAEVIGKPSRTFYEQSIADFDGVMLEDCIMIGDDVRDDVAGAQAVGMKGVLVQTGKYRPGDEKKIEPAPYLLTPSLTEAIDHILSLLPDST